MDIRDSFGWEMSNFVFGYKKKCPFNHTLTLQELYLYSLTFLLHVLVDVMVSSGGKKVKIIIRMQFWFSKTINVVYLGCT